MKRLISTSLVSILLLSTSAFADAKQLKACEFSKRMLTKNPSCSQDLKDAAAKVDCVTDTATAQTQMNDLQAKCVPQAQAKAGETSAKLKELKAAEPTDPRVAELKKQMEAKRAAKTK